MADPHPSSSQGSAARSRAGWLKTLHLWHWISSALCLLGMLLFSVTGRGAGEVITSDDLAGEIVRSWVGGVGLMLAVPLTTLIAALLARRARATP